MGCAYELVDLTEEQAVRLGESEWWKRATQRQIVGFQLFCDRLCVDFGVFHKAVEVVLGRPVWTHEFAQSNVDNLRREFLGDKESPTMKDIIALIPEDKLMILQEAPDGK